MVKVFGNLANVECPCDGIGVCRRDSDTYRKFRENDPRLNYLGFGTDEGSFYHYNTDGAANYNEILGKHVSELAAGLTGTVIIKVHNNRVARIKCIIRISTT